MSAYLAKKQGYQTLYDEGQQQQQQQYQFVPHPAPKVRKGEDRRPLLKKSQSGRGVYKRQCATGGTQATRKRTVKYLSVVRDPKVYNAVVKSSPDSVVKSICDAALNVQRGDRVSLNDNQKKLFRQHRHSIAALASKTVPLARKRKILTQRGGAFFIPALIGAAISGLGSLLFGGQKSQ